MNNLRSKQHQSEPPAMGERRARWGYGYQDKVATARILDILRNEFRGNDSEFEGVRLADLEAARVDDFVLVWKTEVQGNSIKWSGDAAPINWGELIGAHGLLKELADGYSRLSKKWPGKAVTVRLQSNRPPSTEKHSAQLITTFSVADFLRNHWSHGPTGQDPAEVAAVWSRIAEHVGLTGSDFSQFIKACEMVLGFPKPPFADSDSDDLRHYRKQFDDLHKAIATWLTNYPDNQFIDRQILWASIGFRGYRSGLVQHFPPPRIPYEKNGTSAEQLKRLIDSTVGGYLAVTGPAGVGKSTLVQDVLSEYPFFVPYYAYLPDGEGNPRDRGESLTFFQDVIVRLDRFLAHRYSLGIADIGQGRSALRSHMAKANELFVNKGQKVILLVDGLDHVAREIGLERSILLELPRPDEIPDGFLIILSSQPQALLPGTIERHVAAAVDPVSNRRLEVEGLSRPEVHAIAGKARKQTFGAERDNLFNACRGNPLILTYLLNTLETAPQISVADAIELAGNYAGDIDQYYRSVLSVPLGDGDTRYLLGLLSRASPTIPTTWLQDWPERVQLERLYESVLAPFVQEEDGNLRFIHNSLVAFLKEETRSRIPGADPEHDERNYHSILADRCGHPSCVQPLGRAKVFHLLRAERDAELLILLSSSWLREAITAFLPYSEVRPLLLFGLASAWKLEEYGDVIRLILLNYELDQRTARIEPGDLAEKFLQLDRSAIAINQIRSVGRILVDDKVAMRFAANLWDYANARNRRELKAVARTIYLQAKPISLFYQDEPIDTRRHHDFSDTLHAWAEAAPLFESLENIIGQIRRLQFTDSGRGREVDAPAVKAGLLYIALRTVIGWDSDAYRLFLDELTKVNQPTWLFAGLLLLYRKSPSAQILTRLEAAHKNMEPDSDLDLVFAKVLYENGYVDKARPIISRLNHIRCDGFENRHSLGLTDVSYTVTLRYLQQLLGLEEGPVPCVKDDGEEAIARIETTARQLGILMAKAKSGMTIENLRESFRAILLFHNRSIVFPDHDWRRDYIVAQSKPDIYRQLIKLASYIGKTGIHTLLDEFLEILRSLAGEQFLPRHRRLFAVAFLDTGVLSQQDASKLGLSSTSDADDDYPMQRQEACLDIAVFLHTIGDDVSVEEWLARASKLSAGAGSHKDYHMAQLSDWLTHSIGANLNDEKLALLENFLRAIEVAGGAGGSHAATNLIRSLLKIDPRRTTSLSIELIDRDVLNVSETLEALVIGGANAGASPSLLAAVYCEMLSLIHPGESAEAAVTTLRSFPRAQRIAAAQTLMKSARTNSLPSYRMELARAVQDAIRADGLGEVSFVAGLKPGRDDFSRKNSLYKLPAGDLLTADQVAIRLSRADQKCDWNPNPSENTEFNWWQAIKKAEIKDINHLNELISTFHPPEYRNVDLLAWKSERFLEMGDQESARRMAEEAIEKAKDASWFTWLDGAQRRTAYAAIKHFNKSISLQRAREEFGKDLSAGKLYSTYLLDDIVEIFEFLEIEWPSEATIHAVQDYLEAVLGASREVSPFGSLMGASMRGSADEAICRFILHFLAFPVIDVGVAASLDFHSTGND